MRFRGSNHIDASTNLILKERLQDEVREFKLHATDPIGFMETIF
jgi:hypothetical protein